MVLVDFFNDTDYSTDIDLNVLWSHLSRVVTTHAAVVMTSTQPHTTTLINSNSTSFRYNWVWDKGVCGESDSRTPAMNHAEILVFSTGTTGHIAQSKSRMKYNPQGTIILNELRKTPHSESVYRSTDNSKLGYRQTHTNYPRTTITFPSSDSRMTIKLCEYLIRTYTDPGQTVLDFTAGSGTTGVAAINCDRKFIGIESDMQKYIKFRNIIKKHVNGKNMLNNTRFIRGECITKLGMVPNNSVDMVLVDLPYNTTGLSWDIAINPVRMWEQITRVTTSNAVVVMTSIQPYTTTLINSNPTLFKYSLVWSKPRPSGFAQAKNKPMAAHEDILVFHMGNNSSKYIMKYVPHTNSILRFANVQRAIHPTQKPVALCEYLIRTYTDPGQTVLDFTAGSGTTGVAAINCDRKFIGIEMDKKFYSIALERIKEALANADRRRRFSTNWKNDKTQSYQHR